MKLDLAIRLALHGCANRPFYHIVVVQTFRARNFKPIEVLGSWDSLPNKHNEKLVALNFDRYKHYCGIGAQPTPAVAQLLGLAGFYPIHPMTKITAERKRNEKTAQSEDEDCETDSLSDQSQSAAS